MRVLQDGEIEKIGRSESLKVNVRVVAASNKKLEDEVKAKRFREDLFYRLNIIPISIPPLRERKEDIVELLNFFMIKYSDSLRFDKPNFSDQAMEAILNYDWPGNVRELKSFVQRILFVDSDSITAEYVHLSLNNLQLTGEKDNTILDHYFDESKIIHLREFEKIARNKYINFVRNTSSSDKQAADKLGIAQPNFSRLCKDLD